jgi:putative hydrolase of the HAD superfamily
VSSETRVKAIFYDFDGTLHADHPPQLDVFARHAVELGMRIPDEALLQAARWEYYYFGPSEERRADQKDYPEEQSFWGNYVRRQLIALGASTSQAQELTPQLFEYMYQHYRPQDAVLPGVHECLKELKERGYILGIVSNRDAQDNEILNRFDLQSYFSFWLWAEKDGAPKPDRRMFEQALQKAGVEPAQAMHVGDNYYTDVVGARSTGIQPVLLDTRGAYEQSDCLVIRSHSQVLALLED